MTSLEVTTQVLTFIGTAAEGICVSSFLISGKVRRLPVVFCYISYLFVSDVALILLGLRTDIWPALVITTQFGYLVEGAAIWELASNLIRASPGGATPLKWWIAGVCTITSAIGAISFTYLRSYSDFGSPEQRFFHTDQTVCIFRVLILLAILVFLRLDHAGHSALPSHTTILFAAYAVCALLKQVVDELAPRLKLPKGTFQSGEIVCGCVWGLQMITLSWELFRHASTTPGKWSARH
jgi:hypothetical protein